MATQSKRKQRSLVDTVRDDLNIVAAGLLHDLAILQSSERTAIAMDAGCIFALDSDAHSIAEFPFTDYAIAHARIAGIPADRVVNCWDESRFDAWLLERRHAPTA